jgi:hypothetical protein
VKRLVETTAEKKIVVFWLLDALLKPGFVIPSGIIPYFAPYETVYFNFTSFRCFGNFYGLLFNKAAIKNRF